MPNPVRIYVLHHPESKLAARLTDRIYDWFRLPSLEGIPVYVRSVSARPGTPPSKPYGDKYGRGVLEYLLPLVDDRMVCDPVWHDYLGALAARCDPGGAGERPDRGWVMLPVALDSTAFNLPKVVSQRNFIRHGIGPRTEGAAEKEQEAADTEETLKHLTEAMARDLNRRLFPEQAGARFKIFISYARADSTGIAKTLRDYIQGETQCQVFLDENDIAYGQPFDEPIRDHVAVGTAKKSAPAGKAQKTSSGIARAMIVVNGDQYANRPWCRWEIGRFTEPRVLPLDSPPCKGRDIHVFYPVLVVDAVQGREMTRVVPELAQAPVIRWQPERAKLCFSVLMREVLMGLKDVFVARQVLEGDLSGDLAVNRLPGPVAIEQLVRAHAGAGRSRSRREITIHHPGNGLPLIELRLLKKTFEGVRFRAFRDIMQDSARTLKRDVQSKMRKRLKDVESDAAGELPLRGKVIAISTAHSARELAAHGYLPQHQDEALIHLLRPLIRMGADLLYGGYPPTATAPMPGGSSARRNITLTLLQLLADERREDEERVGDHAPPAARGSLLFNVAPWPMNLDITPRDQAAWIHSCRILPVTPAAAGLDPWTQRVPLDTETPPPGFHRYLALTASAQRKGLEGEYRCHLPGEPECTIRPAAFVFMGGKVLDFLGVMPGIMEEFLHAAHTGRPMYLFGGLGGAAGVIARALTDKPGAGRPEELTADHYLEHNVTRRGYDYAALLEELEAAGDPHPREKFDEIWALMQKHRKGKLHLLFNNGLSHEDNKALITTDNTFEAVRLVWKGISHAPGML